MDGQDDAIKSSLQRISIGSYIFQSKIADEFRLNPRDLQAISCLSLHRTLTAGELSRLLALTSGATTALIDRLIDGGFAKRRRDETDGRRVLVELGGARLARLRARYAAINERIDVALGGLPAAHVKIIAGFLSKLSTLSPDDSA